MASAEQAVLPEYYRVLWSLELLQDWQNNPKPTSTHNSFPTQWQTQWEATHSTNPLLYLLELPFMGRLTVFHERARTTFLELIQHTTVDAFTMPELAQCGELAGVAAFSSPQAAYNYAMINPSGLLRIAVFRGVHICNLQEQDGVVVDVVEKGVRMPLDHFVLVHHIAHNAQ